ncbi:tyrosine-type recombinase/integrase [Candidatus Woesearchaeota archaeon]|nr:tyrosine-type recombinase/integrase [Candidatus Woesearchaeota archaeon]
MDIDELIRKHGLRRGFSPKTIKAYRLCVRIFFSRCHKGPNQVKKSDVNDFLDKLIEKDVSGSTINVYLSALKFLFNDILGKRLLVYIHFSRVPKTLPVFLTKEETRCLFGVISNPKHLLMVQLMYGAGLRVSELLHLRTEDFDFKNNIGWVRHGKGNKDRPFIVPISIKQNLIEYISKECPFPDSWLFPGIIRGFPLSSSTVREIVSKAVSKAGIQKNAHPHTLRHSFATHVIEDKNSVTSVQSLLGHANIETTMRYVHMANPALIGVKSPLDCLQGSAPIGAI